MTKKQNKQNSLDYYDSKYFMAQKAVGSKNASEIIHHFRGYIKPSDVVLDFGCGGGFLLNAIDCGKRVGFDINDEALKHASRLGVHTTKDLKSVKNGSVDVVISNSALEHDPNPRESLLALSLKLSVGGLCIFRVPHETLGYKYKKNDWNYHLYTWSPMALGNLFNDVGFEVISVDAEKSKRPPFPWLMPNSLINRFLLKSYRLFRVILDEFGIKVIGVDGYSIIVAKKVKPGEN